MKNNLVIISGPSGAGEDSIINELSKRMPLERVITTTTRDIRPGEKHGRDYYFISKEEFKIKIQKGVFFEYAKQYNENYYGVEYNEINRVINCGRVGIWKIDFQGVKAIKELIPDVISIFINAPLEILEDRIRRRGGISEDYIKERMEYTKKWLQHRDIYDFEVENKEGCLNEAVDRVEKIIRENLLIST